MADASQDISDYRDAIEGLLLNGEELEAVFPAALDTAPNSDGPKAIALTTNRLIVCCRRLDRGKSDYWIFRSLPFSRIQEVQLSRSERFRRDRINSDSSVEVYSDRQHGGNPSALTLKYADNAMAREVHDRILTHLLELEARGLP